jgi:hypothetical protein
MQVQRLRENRSGSGSGARHAPPFAQLAATGQPAGQGQSSRQLRRLRSDRPRSAACVRSAALAGTCRRALHRARCGTRRAQSSARRRRSEGRRSEPGGRRPRGAGFFLRRTAPPAKSSTRCSRRMRSTAAARDVARRVCCKCRLPQHAMHCQQRARKAAHPWACEVKAVLAPAGRLAPPSHKGAPRRKAHPYRPSLTSRPLCRVDGPELCLARPAFDFACCV